MGGCVSKRSRPTQRGLPTRSTEHIPIYVDPDTQTTSQDQPANGDNDEVARTQMDNQHQHQARRDCTSVNTDWGAISHTAVFPTHLTDTLHNETTTDLVSQTAEHSTRATSDNSAVHRHDLIEDDHYDVINDDYLHKLSDSKVDELDETSVQLPDDPTVNTLEIYCTSEDTSASSKEQEETTRIRDRRRCKYYEDMVKVFKPLIVKNLIVHDVLPHLTFLEDEGRIFAAEQRSPQQAVMYLLEEMEKSKEVRKWKHFMTALEQSGYEYIVQNIRGTHAIDNKYQVYYLRTLRAKLSRMIRPREILPRLCAEDIITDNTRQEIEQEETNRGRISAALLLLDRIPRKGTFWYRKFVQVLRDENMDEVADNLEIPEVMNCTNQSFRPAAILPSPDQPKPHGAVDTYDEPYPSISSGPVVSDISVSTSLSSMNCPDSKTTATESPLDSPMIAVTATSQPTSTDHVTDNVPYKTMNFSDTLNTSSVTNNTMGSIHNEEEIYEEPDSNWSPVPPPLVHHKKVNQTENMLQDFNQGYKTYRSPELVTGGSSAESAHKSATMGSVDINDTHASAISIPVDYGLKRVLRKSSDGSVNIKPELRSVEVQVDIAESSPEQTTTEEGYLEPSVIVKHSAVHKETDKMANVRMNDTNAASMEQYEEPYKDKDYRRGTTKDNVYVKHYPDEHQTLRNEVMEIVTETEALKEEIDLLRQKCSVTKERANLLKIKRELQKELEGTDTEYQSLKQSLLRHPSSKEVQEAETLEAEYELYKLYKTKTNRTFSVVSGPLRRTGFSSERVRRRPSINDWRRTTMRKISAGFSGRLFQPELDFLDEPMQPTEIVKLCDFSTTKMANHPAFSDVDSAVFSDFSAYNISEVQ